ncbi:MAG: stage III sporulation protein AG [Clostridioides sp.]|jgi:stage III sporulation protein AG|nr:stage III sporulation protein AG [Clostridioides sp.]
MLKNLLKNFNEKDKKKFCTLLGVAVICLAALVVLEIGSPRQAQKKATAAQATATKAKQEANTGESTELEARLKKILSKIDGAGELDVMITYDSSQEIQPAFNSNNTTEKTDEKDANGGQRTVTTSSENKTMITSDSSQPVVIKTNEAKIKGVIVVASGADDPEVKNTLYSAVQTALQVAGHQVEVYAK